MEKLLHMAGRAVSQPLRDLVEALERTVAAAPRPWPRLILFAAAAVLAWFVYVPVHEMLHVAGCLATGGEVHRVAIDPLYGGRLLSAIVPAVEAGGDYAGRLTSFRTNGSDLCYLATDAAPFLLTLVGVPLLRAATLRRSAAVAGAATILALAPFVSLTGDYFEMSSVIVTRATAPFERPPEPYSGASGLMALRSDDLPSLLKSVAEDPAPFLAGVRGGRVSVAAVILLSALSALLLAFATYGAGHALARWWTASRPAAEEPAGG